MFQAILFKVLSFIVSVVLIASSCTAAERPIATFHHRDVYAISSSDNGDIVATAGEEGVKVWRTLDATCLFEAPKLIDFGIDGEGRAPAIAVSASGKMLAIADSRGCIFIYEVPSRRKKLQVPAQWFEAYDEDGYVLRGVPVRALAFSVDESVLVGAIGPIVVLWNTNDGRIEVKCGSEPPGVKRKGAAIIEEIMQKNTAEADRFGAAIEGLTSDVSIWKGGWTGRVVNVTISDDRQRLGVSRGSVVEMWDVSRGKTLWSKEKFSSIAICSDSNVCAIGSNFAEIQIVDAGTGVKMGRLPSRCARLWFANPSSVACMSGNGITFWNLLTNKPERELVLDKEASEIETWTACGSASRIVVRWKDFLSGQVRVFALSD